MPNIVRQPRQGIPVRRPPAPTSQDNSVDVLSRLKPIGFDPSDGINLLLYGRSGTGKTTLWGTFPEPIVGMICSGGVIAEEGRSLDTEENRSRIQTVTLEASSETRTVTDAVADGSLPCNTLVLDHASGLQDLVLKELVGLKDIPAQKSWGLVTQEQWGQITFQCKDYIRGMLRLRCNVVIVAQERKFGNNSESDVILPSVGAGCTPGLTDWMNQAVSYIGQTFIRKRTVKVAREYGQGKAKRTVYTTQEVPGKVDYCLRTAPDPVYQTKFRLPKGSLELPDVIVDPTYDKILSLIRGGKSE